MDGKVCSVVGEQHKDETNKLFKQRGFKIIMKLLNKVLFGTTVALGFGIVGTNALADTLYTVKSGDTLSAISFEFTGDNSLVNQIAKDNNINDVNLIHVGQELTIKTDGEVVVTTQEADTTNYDTTATYETTESYDNTAAETTSAYTGSSSSAKEWIAQKESGDSYSAMNGQYVGRYQLTDSYLNGDYSPENQERVADQYVADRYGSWENAQTFWINNGWY